jgi:hypothetical protein
MFLIKLFWIDLQDVIQYSVLDINFKLFFIFLVNFIENKTNKRYPPSTPKKNNILTEFFVILFWKLAIFIVLFNECVNMATMNYCLCWSKWRPLSIVKPFIQQFNKNCQFSKQDYKKFCKNIIFFGGGGGVYFVCFVFYKIY